MFWLKTEEALLFSFFTAMQLIHLHYFWELYQQGVGHMIISLIKTQPRESCSLQHESYYNKKLFFLIKPALKL